jgi:hypothetical protein
VSVGGFSAPIPATLIDLSHRGCRITARSIFLTGSTISFDLPQPGSAPIRLRGTIRHTEPSKGGSTEIEFGVEFQSLAVPDDQALASFIAHEQRRGPSSARVETDFPVRATISGERETFSAVALDVSRNGMRLETERSLPENATLILRFALPSFREREVRVRVLHGTQRPRGNYHYSVLFDAPPLDFVKEVERFTAGAL